MTVAVRVRTAFTVAALFAVVACGPHSRAYERDTPPDRDAAHLVADRMVDPTNGSADMRIYMPLFGIGGFARGSSGSAGQLWVSVAPGRLSVMQYVFRYPSEGTAEKAFRDQSPDKALAADMPVGTPILRPDAYRLSADQQTLITPELSASDAASSWVSWARYGKYIVHVVVNSSGPPVPQAELEPLLTAIDRVVASALLTGDGTTESRLPPP
ncbi:hypothetical protein LO772_18930 [Yinghuangia sp. ASG 101]|uniref:hypothetical protein n=1 Tax=Yinghuangia sp. ASG 101 TaxID=2896848 RepID=UPI001E390087|nr:hypothetical protein [Yinghuangia sp. ASG 101]UGQ09046.1 hypothetical protein LO772_18930 [Yinghuangia sp. ASG 101]